MIQKVDAIGYSCPEPLIRLKKVIDEYNEIDLLVSEKNPTEVCGRFAKSKGFTVNVRTENDENGKIYVVEMRK